jgi:FkbM family methyltransferase
MEKYYADILKKLGRKIKKIEKHPTEVLIEMNNGLKYFAPKESPTGEFPVRGEMSELKDYGEFIYILSEQFVSEIYEKHYNIKKGQVIVDIGANIGIFAVKAAKKVGESGKIIAIEPEKRNLEFLKKNVEANNLNNVIIIPEGVWSKRTAKKLFLRGMGGHSFFRRSESYDDMNLDTLDNILKDLDIEKINFIKMDIEGAEIEALKGANTTLKKKTSLAISGYHKINGIPTYKAIISLLKKKGFSVTPVKCTSPNTYYKNEEDLIIYASKL